MAPEIEAVLELRKGLIALREHPDSRIQHAANCFLAGLGGLLILLDSSNDDRSADLEGKVVELLGVGADHGLAYLQERTEAKVSSPPALSLPHLGVARQHSKNLEVLAELLTALRLNLTGELNSARQGSARL